MTCCDDSYAFHCTPMLTSMLNLGSLLFLFSLFMLLSYNSSKLISIAAIDSFLYCFRSCTHVSRPT
ncbi:hypothetical protein AG1IA_09006 [Rhizoctonia solani AG-1 IA]|uniref:Uncharacterized protein n=1 Tax=Thanatephorus cucumeris (strain AG1-IA) TaxID=983506 RepID=L8WJH6_THACA|nr:hypothetical protein AG1IA_09006 [Rhizoctonia solani AG-1 IA]